MGAGRIALALAVAACSSHTAPPAAAAAPAEQDVRAGLAILCASRWNGEVYGTGFMRRLPGELQEHITNDEVMKLVSALASPVRDRTGMFDAFVAENHVGDLGACPFRARLASWPPELPVIPQ